MNAPMPPRIVRLNTGPLYVRGYPLSVEPNTHPVPWSIRCRLRLASMWVSRRAPVILAATLGIGAGVLVAMIVLGQRYEGALAAAQAKAAEVYVPYRNKWPCTPDRKIAGVWHCLDLEVYRAKS